MLQMRHRISFFIVNKSGLQTTSVVGTLASHGSQNMEGVLVVGGGGTRTPSEHYPGTLEQGTEPTNAHIGLCNELVTHPGFDLPSPIVSPAQEIKQK